MSIPPSRLRRAARGALFAVLFTVALVALAAVGLVFASRHPAVGRLLLERLAATLDETAGLRLTAERLDLHPASLRLELVGAALAAGETALPFLTVDRLQVSVDTRLLRGDLALRRLEVDGATLDLGAPLPQSETPAPPPSSQDLRFEIDELSLNGVYIEGLPGEAPFDGLLVDGLDIDGTLRDARLDLAFDVGRVEIVVRGQRFAAIRLHGETAVLLDDGIVLERASLAGDGVELAARPLPGDEGLAVTLRAEPLTLVLSPLVPPKGTVPGITSTQGFLEVVGELRFGATQGGELRLEGRELPLALMGELPGVAPLPDLLATTVIDAEGEIVLDDGLESGHVALVLRRRAGEGPIVEAEIDVRRGEVADESPLVLRADGRLLPGLDGKRRLTGELRATGWDTILDGTVSAHLEVRQDAKGDDLAALERGWPGLLPLLDAQTWAARLEELVPGAAWQVDVRAEGPLRQPTASFALLVERHAESLLTANAVGEPRLGEPRLGQPWSFDVEATLLPQLDGYRRLTGAVTVDLGRPEVVDLDAARGEIELPLADLRRDLGARWSELAAALERRLVDAGGEPARLSGTLSGDVRVRNGEIDASFRVDSLDLASFGHGLEGRLDGELGWHQTSAGRELSLDLDAPAVVLGDVVLEEAHLRATGDASCLHVAMLAARFADGPLAGVGVEARVELPFREPFTGAEAVVTLRDLPQGLAPTEVTLHLDGGTVRARSNVELGDRQTSLTAALPLATLARAVPSLAPSLESLPLPVDHGPLVATFEGLELEELPPYLGFDGEEKPAWPRATAHGSLRFDPDVPGEVAGRLTLEGLRFAAPRGEIAATAPLELTLEGRELTLHPVELRRGDQSLKGRGRARLAAWPVPATTSLDDWIESLAVEAAGEIGLDFLAPWTGGQGHGTLQLDARLAGPPEALGARLVVTGPDAELTYSSPYLTRITVPDVVLVAERGELTIESARARLNGGELTLGGGWRRGEGFQLTAEARGVRYRLDYGLTVLGNADLELTSSPWGEGGGPPEESPRLRGRIFLERGVVRRDIPLTRELLARLFAPQLTITDDFSDTLALDLVIATREGVRIKNNLADLRATWTPLLVSGTLTRPVLAGLLEVDPGGKLYAYGQTVRLDTATIRFPGDPEIAPHLELETTSSLEDPSLRHDAGMWGEEMWENPIEDLETGRDDGDVDVTDQLNEGLREHYGDLLAGSLGKALGTDLSYRPLAIFGESNPEARLVVTQHLSPEVDLSAAFDVRTAEGQIYLLEVHNLAALPRFRFQAFTNDLAKAGLVVQQTVEIDGRPRGGEKGDPLDAREQEGERQLRRLIFEVPEGVRKRRLERAVDLDKGDALPAGSAFDVEIDVFEALRKAGYPNARVTVEERPAGDRHSDLLVTASPGALVEVAFTGDRPPRSLRRSFASIYQPGPRDEATRDELRQRTVQALRGLGFLAPEVTVSRESDPEETVSPPLDPPRGTVRVRVHGVGGRRIDPGPPRFPDLEDVDAAYLAGRFADRQSRVELAAGDPAAQRRLVDSLAALGYPAARVTGQELSADGGDLVVHLDPGPRQRLASVRIEGLDKGETRRLERELLVRPGDPVRRDALARSALAIDKALKERGHADAQTRIVLADAGDDVPGGTPENAMTLVFDVEPGPSYRVDAVRFEGLGVTRESWARKVARVEPETVLVGDVLSDARRRLYSSGVFERVATSAEKRDDAGSTVVFDVEEKPRYSVAYGGRWEEGEGLGVVVDATDRNLLGHGVTIGMRALWSDAEQRLRAYTALPLRGKHSRGTKSHLELFVEASVDERQPERRESAWTTSAQITIPLRKDLRTRFYGVYADRRLREPTPDGAFVDERLVSPILGWQLFLDRREDPLGVKQDPRGRFLSIDISGASQTLGSDFSALGLFTQLKLFEPLGKSSRRRRPPPGGGRARSAWTWAQSYRFSLLETFDNELPQVDRLFAGGEFSVRGYPFNSLGPKSADGGPLGGEVMLVVNQELRLSMGKKWTGLVFFDAGNVWETRASFAAKLFTSAGVGVRATTPIGPLRLDFALPLDRREGDPSYKVYFGFGNAF